MPRLPLRLFLFLLVAGLLRGQGTVTAQIENSQSQPLADAVISLTPLDASVSPPTVATPVEIEQVNEEYVPYVTPVRIGTRVDFPNRDIVQHHLYSVSKAKRFEKPLYASGSSESVVFDQPGVVTLGCNIHDWMSAYVVVLETPWFAKTGADGFATVSNLPPGRYRLEVWHPRLAAATTREIQVEATPATPEKFTLALKPDRRIRRAPDGRTKSY